MNVPASLMQYIKQDRCVLFVGSGLSAWAGLPTWYGLLKRMVEQLRCDALIEHEHAELEKLLGNGKLLEVADYCKEKLGKQRFAMCLSDCFRAENETLPEPHKIIARLPFSAVITTNYDKLLERAYCETHGGWPKAPTHLDTDSLGTLLFDKSFFILKSHGDIDRPDSLVLTTGDYKKIIYENPAFNAVFSAILLTKAVLFVGYSIGDPDFQQLMDRQLTSFRGQIPERYAVMSGVGCVERDVLWRTARIHVLNYEEGKHEKVLEFFKELENKLSLALETQSLIFSTVLAAPAPNPVSPTGAISIAAANEKPVTAGTLKPDRLKERDVQILETEQVTSVPSLDAQKPETAFGESFSISSANAARTKMTPFSLVSIATTKLSLSLHGNELVANLCTPEDPDGIQGTRRAPEWYRLTKLLSQSLYTSKMKHIRIVSQELAKAIPDSLLRALATISKENVIELCLSADIEVLPWEWLPIENQLLLERNPTVRAPMNISNQARGYPVINKPPKILVIGDPTEDLQGAREEAIEIARIYGDHAMLLLGTNASFDACVYHLSNHYDVVHFAGHAWTDTREGHIMLSNKVILRASELRNLISRRPPAFMILNSHYTAFRPSGDAQVSLDQTIGTESGFSRDGEGGFSATVLAAGVGGFIGCVGSIEDRAACKLALELHHRLVHGFSAQRALYEARIATRNEFSESSTWAMYVLSGYPEIVLR